MVRELISQMNVNSQKIRHRMKVTRNKKVLELYSMEIIQWLDYILKDINSYDELTDEEKSIISPAAFDILTER